MNDSGKYADLKTSCFGFKLIFGAIAAILIFIVIGWYALYPLRNWDRNEVGLKFIRNNSTIREEVGEITAIDGFGLVGKSRSEELAEKLREGKELSENSNSADRFQSGDGKVRKLTAEEAEWHTARITGTKKTIEVSLRLPKSQFGDTSNVAIYYKVAEAKLKDNTGNWKVLPIGWFENDRLLFK